MRKEKISNGYYAHILFIQAMSNANHNLPQLLIYHIFTTKFGGRSQDKKIGKVISMSELINNSYINTCSTY